MPPQSPGGLTPSRPAVTTTGHKKKKPKKRTLEQALNQYASQRGGPIAQRTAIEYTPWQQRKRRQRARQREFAEQPGRGGLIGGLNESGSALKFDLGHARRRPRVPRAPRDTPSFLDAYNPGYRLGGANARMFDYLVAAGGRRLRQFGPTMGRGPRGNFDLNFEARNERNLKMAEAGVEGYVKLEPRAVGRYPIDKAAEAAGVEFGIPQSGGPTWLDRQFQSAVDMVYGIPTGVYATGQAVAHDIKAGDLFSFGSDTESMKIAKAMGRSWWEGLTDEPWQDIPAFLSSALPLAGLTAGTAARLGGVGRLAGLVTKGVPLNDALNLTTFGRLAGKSTPQALGRFIKQGADPGRRVVTVPGPREIVEGKVLRDPTGKHIHFTSQHPQIYRAQQMIEETKAEMARLPKGSPQRAEYKARIAEAQDIIDQIVAGGVPRKPGMLVEGKVVPPGGGGGRVFPAHEPPIERAGPPQTIQIGSYSYSPLRRALQKAMDRSGLTGRIPMDESSRLKHFSPVRRWETTAARMRLGELAALDSAKKWNLAMEDLVQMSPKRPYGGSKYVEWEEQARLAQRNPVAAVKQAMEGNLARTIFETPTNLGLMSWLYANPAYIRNLPGNILFNLIHGSGGKLGSALVARTRWDKGLYNQIRNQVQSGGMSMGMLGPDPQPLNVTGRANRYLAGKWSRITDETPRVAAFLEEAARRGFTTEEDLFNLLNKDDLRGYLDEVTVNANKEMVDFSNLGKYERSIMRDVFAFYPWMKGSGQWAPRAALEHPIKTGALMQAGQYGHDYTVDKLGGMPSFLYGITPTGQTVATIAGERKVVPTARQLTSMNPFTAAADIPETLRNMIFGGGKRRFELTEYLTPGLQIAASAALKYDPFRHSAISPTQGFLETASGQGGDMSPHYAWVKRYLQTPADQSEKLWLDLPGKSDDIEAALLGTSANRAINPPVQKSLFRTERSELEGSDKVKAYRTVFKDREESAQKALKHRGQIPDSWLDGNRFSKPIRAAWNRKAELEGVLADAKVLRHEGGGSLTKQDWSKRLVLTAELAYKHKLISKKRLEYEKKMAKKREIGGPGGLSSRMTKLRDIIYNNRLSPVNTRLDDFND